MPRRTVRRVSHLEDALDRLLAATTPLPVEPVSVWKAAGRVAAADVAAPGPVPHFARPAMDGYVCHDADVRNASPGRPAVLRISGAVRMGEPPGHGPGPGEAWSITTGAPMPERGDHLRVPGGLRSEIGRHRIGRHCVGQQEGQEGDADQHRGEQQHPPADVSPEAHRARLGVADARRCALTRTC